MHKNIFIAIVLIFLFVTGCGDPNSRTASGTGAVAFGVIWQSAPTLAPGVESAPQFAPLDCAASVVSTVSALAYSVSNALLASGGPWNCSDHHGTISNIPAQSNVKVVVLARDASGNVLYRGEQTGVAVTAGQTTDAGTIVAFLFEPALMAPANGSTVTNGSFNFSWTSTGTSYEIQVSDNSGFTSTVIDQTVTATMYTPTTALSPGTYYCRVKSLDGYGNASAWSTVWNFTVSGVTGAPTGVSPAPGDRQVTISWNTVTGATSYNIYWSTSTGVTTTNGTQVPNVFSPHAVTGLTNGTTYYFIVTAVNSYGESSASAQVSATPSALPPPPAPTGVTASSGNNQNTISWNPVMGATSYNIYWSLSSNVTTTSSKIAGITNVTYTHPSLTNFTTYYYIVTAVNANGESTASAVVSASPGSNLWIWTSGTNTTGQAGIYGTKYFASSSNIPGGRYGAVSWTDSTNKLWLFGGEGYDSAGNGGDLNDLWMFDGTLWTWESGTNTTNQAGNYGTKGVAAPTNVPGARAFSVTWTDSNNTLWLFGGEGYSGTRLNDLWRSNGTSWIWVSGSNTANQIGTYGAKGVAAASNVPGARYGAVSWIDSNNYLWLFGGSGYPSTGTTGSLNDLWKFDGTNWTWVSGSNTANQIGIYGTKGVATASNVPGARYGSVSWRDSTNKLWLFGGFGYDSTGVSGSLNDLWKFDGTNWTWVSGATTTNQSGNYGTKGAAAASNVPGARYNAISWIDSNNNLWLFGGVGVGGSLPNDLWKFDGTNWSWVSGSNATSQYGVYGTKGVGDASNVPGSRYWSVSWIDTNSTLWLFGGAGLGAASIGSLNDLWCYHPWP